jgi:glycosyltransferase involved in cell wall biosynthesis
MNLLVVSHVTHYRHQGRLWAYGPYTRELDLWAGMFKQIRIASPCVTAVPPPDCMAFEWENIVMLPQAMAGGETALAKLRLAVTLPAMIFGLMRAMFRADAIHVRCPGNLGLLGVILAPLFCRRLVAKYAAQWCGVVNEPLSYRMQRYILASRWWRGPVTVYGKWPGQPSNVVPFFTSLLDAGQLDRAIRACRAERPRNVLRVLFTGRLTKSKNVHVLLRALTWVRAQGYAIECRIVGEGPERDALGRLTAELDLGGVVHFVGGVDFDHVLGFLETSDVLVLASETEGWAKSLAEAMAFGLVCIGSNRGLVLQMLGEGRGMLVPPRDVPALAGILCDIARSPERYEDMRVLAAAWAQRFSIENLRTALEDLLAERWAMKLKPVHGRRQLA